MGDQSFVRRRRRHRDHIPEDQYRNITARIEGKTFNRLVDLANTTNTSISHIVECVIANRKIEVLQPIAPPAAEHHAAVEAAIRKFLAAEAGA